MAKIYTYILTQPIPQGHLMSVVWNPYMNLQSKFGYCITTKTLNIALCKRDGITDRQTGRQTDDPITRCPRLTFQVGGIKSVLQYSTDLNRLPASASPPTTCGQICLVKRHSNSKTFFKLLEASGKFCRVSNQLCRYVKYI